MTFSASFGNMRDLSRRNGDVLRLSKNAPSAFLRLPLQHDTEAAICTISLHDEKVTVEAGSENFGPSDLISI